MQWTWLLIQHCANCVRNIQATNKSVKELREEFEAIATETKQTRNRVDSVQAAALEDRRTVTDLKNQLERLTEKMKDMEGQMQEEQRKDWWVYQKARRIPTRLVSSELIFPSGFLPWGAMTLRLIGATCVWRREGLRSAAHSHLPCIEMAWQIRYPEGCSAGLSSEMHTEQCHTAIFSRLQSSYSDQEKGIWSGFEEDDSAWSPALSHLSGGNQTTAQGWAGKLRFPSESGGFYQLPVSAADVCRGSAGRGRGNSGHYLSSPAGGA